MYEREILYKLLFDLKRVFNELKSLMFELIRSNNLDVPDISRIRSLAQEEGISSERVLDEIGAIAPDPFEIGNIGSEHNDPNKTVIIHHPSEEPFQRMEIVEENLSLEDMEKDMKRNVEPRTHVQWKERVWQNRFKRRQRSQKLEKSMREITCGQGIQEQVVTWQDNKRDVQIGGQVT